MILIWVSFVVAVVNVVVASHQDCAIFVKVNEWHSFARFVGWVFFSFFVFGVGDELKQKLLQEKSKNMICQKSPFQMNSRIK